MDKERGVIVAALNALRQDEGGRAKRTTLPIPIGGSTVRAAEHIGRGTVESWRGQRNATRKAVLDLMSDGRPRQVKEVAYALNKTPNAASAAIRALADDGKLRKYGRKTGVYKVSDRGAIAGNG